MKAFDTYLFDFDGTLVDSYESLVLVFSGAYKAVGIEVPEGYTRRLMRCPLFTGYEELNAPDNEESKKIFASKIVRLLDDPEVLKVTKPYKDTIEVLTKLKEEGKTLGIVTSNSRKHVQDVLRFLGIDEKLFSVILGNEATKRHKPYPDPILNALSVLGISQYRVCYVGDALDDMNSAVAAGVGTVLIDRLDEYHGHAYDYQFKNLYGLLK